MAITSSGDVYYIPAPVNPAHPSLSDPRPPVLPQVRVRIDLEAVAVWGVVQVRFRSPFLFLYEYDSLETTHCLQSLILRLFSQHTTHIDHCVVIVKDIISSSIMFMMVSGSNDAVLLPLNCPPLPSDAWLLWCEGEESSSAMIVVLATVCGRERYVAVVLR